MGWIVWQWVSEGDSGSEDWVKVQACSETRLKHVRKSLARLAVGLGHSLVSSLDAVASSVFCTLVRAEAPFSKRSAAVPGL
jgi:hypothetical protein